MTDNSRAHWAMPRARFSMTSRMPLPYRRCYQKLNGHELR